MNKEIEAMIAKLPPKEREALAERMDNLERTAMSLAGGGIMTRNFSHNLGIYVLEDCREQ